MVSVDPAAFTPTKFSVFFQCAKPIMETLPLHLSPSLLSAT